MALNNPYQAYQQNSVLTAPPAQLTLILYNGCIKFIRLAKKGLLEQDIQAKHENLIKAQRIISELMSTLSMDYEVAHHMYRLYDYMLNRLIEANIKNDMEILTEVEGLVVEFRDTWAQAMQLNNHQAKGTADHE